MVEEVLVEEGEAEGEEEIGSPGEMTCIPDWSCLFVVLF